MLIEGSYDDGLAELGKEADDRLVYETVLIFLYKYWKKSHNSNTDIFLQSTKVTA
jgi:hypothetical protein